MWIRRNKKKLFELRLVTIKKNVSLYVLMTKKTPCELWHKLVKNIVLVLPILQKNREIFFWKTWKKVKKPKILCYVIKERSRIYIFKEIKQLPTNLLNRHVDFWRDNNLTNRQPILIFQKLSYQKITLFKKISKFQNQP